MIRVADEQLRVFRRCLGQEVVDGRAELRVRREELTGAEPRLRRVEAEQPRSGPASTRNASVRAASGVSASSGAMLSSTQMLRPCVPTMRSLSRGWISDVVHRHVRHVQVERRPATRRRRCDTWMPRSWPTKSSRAFRGCSRSRLTDVCRQPGGDRPPRLGRNRR